MNDIISKSLMEWIGMDNTIKVYKEEKELREKRLAAYAEAIREKVENDSI